MRSKYSMGYIFYWVEKKIHQEQHLKKYNT